MTWDEIASLASERIDVCHGYRCGCVCERCTDRALRYAELEREGEPNAAALAKRRSEDYFTQPWRYWDAGDGTAPQLLSALGGRDEHAQLQGNPGVPG